MSDRAQLSETVLALFGSLRSQIDQTGDFFCCPIIRTVYQGSNRFDVHWRADPRTLSFAHRVCSVFAEPTGLLVSSHPLGRAPHLRPTPIWREIPYNDANLLPLLHAAIADIDQAKRAVS